jgi:hypothetical protein
VQSLQHHHESSRGWENGVIGIPLYVFVILILGTIMLFGVIAFTLMAALGFPSVKQEALSTTGSDRAGAADGRVGYAGLRILLAGLLGIMWVFIWMMIFGVLNHIYRGSSQFDPTDPNRMVRISFFISISILCGLILLTRMVIWMRNKRGNTSLTRT